MLIIPFLSNQGVLSYLIVNRAKQAILIDPSYDSAQEIVKTIKKDSLNLEYILETHTHADFFSAKSLFKTLYPTAKSAMSEFSPSKQTDIKLKNGDKVEIEEVKIKVLQTSGHTSESLVYILNGDSKTYAFTGDTLLIGGTGRTDFQAGSSQSLYESLQKILTFKPNTIIYPGHNYKGITSTTLQDEIDNNPRLKLAKEGKQTEFIELMNSHKPPKPDLFEEAIRFNSL